MNREELQSLFCMKISLEYACFRKDMIEKPAEDVFNHAYEIDSVINIYECLLEISQELEEKVLSYLILFPNLLAFLYMRWLKQEDSYVTELWDCIKQEIPLLQKRVTDGKGERAL